MNEREDFGEIVATAFIGSMIGASLFVLAFALVSLAPQINGDQVPFMIVFVMYAWIIGIVIAMLTAWPVGAIMGWLLSLTGPTTGTKAATGGFMTAFALIAAIFLLDGRPLAAVSSVEWVIFTGFTLLGAFSGWLSYRVVLRPKPVAE